MQGFIKAGFGIWHWNLWPSHFRIWKTCAGTITFSKNRKKPNEDMSFILSFKEQSHGQFDAAIVALTTALRDSEL
jgi:hypothetical protein